MNRLAAVSRPRRMKAASLLLALGDQGSLTDLSRRVNPAVDVSAPLCSSARSLVRQRPRFNP